MCGIVGIRRFDGARVDPERLRALADVLTHRGPDGAGVWISADGTAGLAHRRLSIIDVAGSPQPMSSVDGRVHVVFNGEIFNYRELRDALDYPWRTAGDTEVLLAGFLEGGPGFVERLRGQFAYGIVDERDGQLWLHRDRLGILPLYWYRDEDVLVFASEIKAILPALPRAPEVDEESLADYLAHRSVPTPHTMFRGVRKLPPGHRLLARPDGRVTVERYWALPVEPAREHVPDAEALTLVGEALRDSVRAALVADVPVGAYLSGGIDSSLIVAMISSLREGEGVETFSANFEQTSHDELPFARKVSAHLGTTHHEITVTARDFEQLWPKLTWHVDAPLPEPPDIAFHRLATLARRHVKVVLSGEGSDELFAGYPKYRYARLVQASGTLPAAVRGPVFGALERALPDRARRPRTLLRAAAARTEAERFRTWFAPFTAEERLELAGSAGRGGYEEIWRRARGDVIQRMLYVDCHTWLVDNLLERGDRTSMAASLELRPPFLDHRLVELAFTLPSRVKVRRGTTKWVVRELGRRYLPEEITRRPKLGFRVPFDVWLRGSLREMARDMLCSPSSFVGQVMDRPAVERLLDDHERGRRNEWQRIYTLLSLEVWHQAFFRG